MAIDAEGDMMKQARIENSESSFAPKQKVVLDSHGNLLKWDGKDWNPVATAGLEEMESEIDK
jgi:hypothetical protein